jgi:type IV pilus assembly protein PilC
VRRFSAGRYGWDLFVLKLPVFGPLIEKNIIARTTRTLGTLVASGVPILEAMNITKETSGNAVFENLYQKVHEAIREGEAVAQPLKDHSKPGFHPVALFFWFMFIGGPIGVLLYMTRMNDRIIDDMVVNMVDVGEETGELDTMLYKVADNYDDEVKVITEALTRLMEPLLIIVLGGMVGFIVISLFLPLVALITKLS